ncbi:MAG: alpha/beta fold hydrolase, partial [Candidatus Omnitrophica bacterium]|nr:alpha/beta fold hydrolase [Candidatus Omnitrophota bacterium]
FDFRAHGGSGGRVTSFGWREQRDLEGALAFLGQQPDVSAKPYGVYGISMGGAVALMAAARDERLAAVVADSSYPSLEDALGRHLTLLYPVPKVPFLWFVLATYRLRFGVWPRDVSPQDSATRLSPRAVLLIHGADDPRMPVAGTQRMFAAAAEPKELWVIEGAQHLEGYGLAPQAYRDRLVRFFQAHLGSI